MGQKNDENIMGTGRVPAVLLKMGIPIIVSMVLQAMYNIVDSMFVSRMPDLPNLEHAGEYAVNALTLAFPIQMLIVAFGIGTGVGVGAMLSRLLGMKDIEGVAKTAGNGVFLGILISAAFVVFGLFGIDPYLKSQTQDPVIFQWAEAIFGSVLICAWEMFCGGCTRNYCSRPGKPCCPQPRRLPGR